MIGAFALVGARVGDAVAATVVYRGVTCWIVAAVGSVLLVVISRRRPQPAALDRPTHASDDPPDVVAPGGSGATR